MNPQFGKPMYEATLEEGVGRLWPILMATMAMIAGNWRRESKLSARWRWR